MRIRLKRDMKTQGLTAGDVVEKDDHVASEWIRFGVAEAVDEPKPKLRRDRMKRGSRKTRTPETQGDET